MAFCIRFDRKKNPAALATDGSRYALHGVTMVRHRGAPYLASTDGRGAVLVALSGGDDDARAADALHGKAMPKEAFALARKAFGQIRAEAATVADHVTGATFPMIDQRVPDVAAVVPSSSAAGKVTLDAALLATLQKALGADGVTIELRGNGEPLVIRPHYGKGNKAAQDGSFGVMMPIA